MESSSCMSDRAGISKFAKRVNNSHSYRSQIVVFIVFGIPESPRWLYYHDRSEEARQVICDVWDLDPQHTAMLHQEREILDAIALEKKHGVYQWTKLFKRDEVQTGRRVLLAWGMQFMNQLCGINLIV